MNQLRNSIPRTIAMFAMVLALTAFANAETKTHKGIHAKLKLSTATEVGGAILQPGDYEVVEVDSAEGPVLQFVHQFRNELASELVQADEEEIVARVKFSEQVLSSPPEHTQLRAAARPSDAVALEIRGTPVDYVLDSPKMSASADPSVCVPSGMHE